MGIYDYRCLKCNSDDLTYDENKSKPGKPYFICRTCEQKGPQDFKGGFYFDGERRELSERFPVPA